jgi:tetratricopeptide (TPR) repeat protein
LEQLADADHWKKVRALSQERLQRNPNDARAYYQLSKAAVSFGEPEDGIEPIEKALKLDGSQSEYHAEAAEVYARMAKRAGLVKQVVYLHRLKHELEQAFAIDPRNLDALLVQMMFDWKAPSVVGGDRRKAFEVVDELKAAHPVWGYLAEAKLVQDEDRSRTQHALERAANLEPNFYLAQSLLAEFYGKTAHRFSDAERLAKRSIQIDRSRSAAYSVLARVYAAEGKYSELDQVLKEAEAQNPDDLSPYYFAAQTLVDTKGDVGRAEQFTRKYLSQSPEGRAPGLPEARELLASIPKPAASHSASGAKPSANRTGA